MPWTHQPADADSERLVLCEVGADCKGKSCEVYELAHLLFKLSELSKRVEPFDSPGPLRRHIVKKIQKAKAEIIETFVSGNPTPEFVAGIVYRIRSVQHNIENFERYFVSSDCSGETSGAEFFSYAIHNVSDRSLPKTHKRQATKPPTKAKSNKPTKRGKKPKTPDKPKSARGQKSPTKYPWNQRTQKPLKLNPEPGPPVEQREVCRTVAPDDNLINSKKAEYISRCEPFHKAGTCIDKNCKYCIKKYQNGQGETQRVMCSIRRRGDNYESDGSRDLVCTIVPSRTSVRSRRKANRYRPDLQRKSSYKILKKCPGLCCPVHATYRERRKEQHCQNQKKDTLLDSAKAFAKTVAGRGAAFVSPICFQQKKGAPKMAGCEDNLRRKFSIADTKPKTPHAGRSPKRACGGKETRGQQSSPLKFKESPPTSPMKKPVSTPPVKLLSKIASSRLKQQKCDRGTSYENFYINPLGLPDKNRFRPLENKLINEEWRYFGDDYPLKLGKIEHFRGEGVEYAVRGCPTNRNRVDSGTQTDGAHFPVEYKVANMNIVYSKTHLKYILPSWKEISTETVNSPKILYKKELEDGLAVTTYKTDPDGTVHFTLAYSTDNSNEDELSEKPSEQLLGKLKDVKDIWVQSARHLYDSLRETYSSSI